MRKLIPFLICFIGFSCTSRKQTYLNIIEKEKASIPNYVSQKDESDRPYLEGSLNLEDALKIALQYNKQLKATLEEKAISKGRETEAISFIMPNLNASASYSHLKHTLVIKGKTVNVSDLNNYSLDLMVRQPIFHGGALYANIVAASLGRHLADEQIRGQVQRTIFETTKAYLDVLLARSLFQVAEKAVLSAKGHLKEVESKLEEGISSQFDKLRAQVEASNFEAGLIKQQNHLNLAEKALLKIIGASLKSKVKLTDGLNYEPFQIKLSKALKTALLNRHEVMSAALALGVQEEMLKRAKAGFLPKINGFAGYKWGKPEPQSNTTDSWGRAFSGGVSLEWPLFDGLRTKGAVDKEKALVRQKEFMLKNIKEMVSLNVEQALLSLQDADALVSSQKMDLKSAKEALELAELRFKEGMAPEIVVTDALSATARSESIYYSALYQHALARLNLDLAMGILSPAKQEGMK
jgi:outer membrane protein